ncbi:MAG: MFS transporter [Caldilineaceae bacterium]
MDAIEPPRTPNLPPEVVPLRARQFRVPKTFSAIRHRNFRLYMGGQLVSLVGTWMQIIAQGWLVYQLSHSELALGIVGFASAIPALLVSPWAGVIVDQVSKRNLIVATQTGAMILAFILAVLDFAHIVQVWHVVVLAVGLGFVNAFDGPARQAFVVEMVGREDLPNAIAMNSMTFNSARIVGPGLGGLLLAAVGSSWCFLLNGISFLAVIVSLFAMKLQPNERKPLALSPWKQLTSGVIYAKNTPELRGLLLMALFFSLFGISYSTVLPAFVDKVLRQGADAFGVINAMSGIGAVTGAFLIAQYGDRGQRGRWLAWAALLFPVVLSSFALNHNYPLAMVLALLMGVGFMITFTLINTLLQTRLQDEMRGRVLSLYTLTFFGFTPFGNLAIGSLSERWGLSEAIIASAVASFALSALVLFTTKQVRELP